jgi:hypothetical protein
MLYNFYFLVHFLCSIFDVFQVKNSTPQSHAFQFEIGLQRCQAA